MRDKDVNAPAGSTKQAGPANSREDSSAPKPQQKANVTSKNFLNFVTSLGLQAMMLLGEIPNPETNVREINLEGAKEVVDLLIELKGKTQGNLSEDEKQFFDRFLPELQLKYAQKI